MDADVETKAEEFVKELSKGESTGHDYWHSIRVRNTALLICATEPSADKRIVAVAALLHDTDDRKLNGDWVHLPNATKFLEDNGVSQDEINTVRNIIRCISFKGNATRVPETIEGKIVQDADRLDAMGAIGIARAFAYGGKAGRPLYDPSAKPRDNMTEAEYYADSRDSVTHFHEKLLRLKGMMNTATGKRLAQHRHDYMMGFLHEFADEWEGII